MIPAALENAVYGLVAAPARHLALRRGVLPLLRTPGGRTAEEAAKHLGLDADTTERLLLVLVASGLLHRDDSGRYTVDAAADPFLDPDHPRFIGGFVAHLVDGTPGRVEKLDAYLARGKAAVDADGPAAYDHMYRDSASTAEFMAAMWTLSHGVSHDLVALAGLDDARVLVDVGGANGPFAVAALRRHPELRAVVFDLPLVGPHLRATAERTGLTERLSFTGGDFFTDDLPAGDVIALGYVMSNWPDEDCVRLLRAAHTACRPGGRVLIMDRLFADDRSGPLATAVMNLLMQVETHGRHRTVAEFRTLLELAGFTGVTAHRSDLDKHLIIGHRAEGD